MAGIWTVKNWFLSSWVRLTQVKLAFWYQCEWPWSPFTVMWLWENKNLRNQSVVNGKWYEVAQTFAAVDHVKWMTAILPCQTTFTVHILACGSQSQRKAKPNGIIFLTHFSLIRMKFDVMMKQFKLNILRLLLSKIYFHKGNNCFFYWLHPKQINISVHADVCM